MSAKSRILPMLVLTAAMGLSACVVHDPYRYGYSRGYHGHNYVYSEYPRRTVVYRRDYDDRRHHDRDGRWSWRRDRDRDRDNDGIHDRYDRYD